MEPLEVMLYMVRHAAASGRTTPRYMSCKWRNVCWLMSRRTASAQ